MPEAAPALVEIVFLALVLFTIALAFSARKITQALFGWLIAALETIPLIGGKLAGPFKTVEQAVTNACGEIVSKCEAMVGASFHVLANVMDWLWKQTVAQAAASLHIAQLLATTVYSLSGLKAIVHRLEQTWHGIEHGVKTLTKQYHGIEHRVSKLERELSRGIGHDVRSSLDTLERDVNKLTAKTIPAISGEAAKAEADVTALGQYVKDHYLSNATADLEAAVALGLTALGLGGLRCNSNPFKDNPNACGMWTDFADLLGLALALGVAVDFNAFVGECQAIVGDTVGAVEAVAGLA